MSSRHDSTIRFCTCFLGHKGKVTDISFVFKKIAVAYIVKITYKSYNRNDFLLFPPSLGGFIFENYPVRRVSAIIDRPDISGIELTCNGGGTSSFHPRILLKVIAYSYMCNVCCTRTRATCGFRGCPAGLPYDKPFPQQAPVRRPVCFA